MLWYSIPSLAYESQPRDRDMGVLSEQQDRWELLRAAEEITCPGGIKSKTSALIPY
jgi:hypothetical protein